MRTELTRTYPVALKKGFDYLDDFRMWPDWYAGLMRIIEPATCAWSEPGDVVRFEYKLLGRRVEGQCILEERAEGKLARFRSEIPGLPVVHFTYHYSEVDPEAFMLRAEMETEEPTSFFGRTIDKTVLPRVLSRDLERSMENLQDIFEMGTVE